MKAITTTIEAVGKTGRTVMTKTVFGNTTRVMVVFANGTANVTFLKNN